MPAPEHRFSLTIEDSPYAFQVLAFDGTEGISRPYAFTIDLVSECADPDLEQLLHKQAFLAFDGMESGIHGQIYQVSQRDPGRRLTHYSVTLAPHFSYLAHRTNQRIFQSLTVPQIISLVLKDHGIFESAHQFQLNTRYLPREYCVQYQETDLHFIQRLCEEEGMHFHFQHSRKSHVLVFGDNQSIFRKLARATAYHQDSGMAADEPVVRSFGTRLEARTSHTEGGTRLLQAFGPGINDFVHWVKSTAHAISIGQVARIVNSPAVQNSGGLAPMVVLLLNTLNTHNYLNQAGALEEMDEQRVNDTASAALYWGAALVAVLDSQVRKGMGINQINLRFSATPTLTVFGGIIGGLSAVAAFKEFKSLSTQLENSQSSVDPWLKIRKSLVGGQVAAYGAQAIVGIAYTSRALLGIISVDAATAGFMVWMGPLIWIIALLGVLYLIAWYLQQTPLQNFLSNCCWSRQRAHDQSPISQKRQMEELDRLYLILYAPRISFTAEEEALPADNRDGITYQGYIKTLTIDLPGATPNNIRLDLSMIGDPMDYQLWLETRGAPGLTERPHTVRNMGAHWLRNSTCEWIPAAQGQGLRLTGVFKRVDRELGSLPRSVSLRVRYGTPFTALYGVQGFIGGARGLAFTVTTENGVIALRNDPTPKLDGAQVYKLGEQQCSVFLQPGIRR